MNKKNYIFHILIEIFSMPYLLSALIVLFIVLQVVSSLNILSETITCTGIRCITVNNSNIRLGRDVHTERILIRNKNLLEIQTLHDNIFHLNQYYIKTSNDNEHYAFRTSYLIRANAERDLRLIKENYNVSITKRNVIYIQILCVITYILLLIIGKMFYNKKRKET